MTRLQEIVDRYHINGKSGDFIVRKMFKLENKNQVVKDFLWLVETLKVIRGLMQ